MKKTVLSVLLALALVVCALVIAAPAAQAAAPIPYHCLCGNKHSTALVDGTITWKEGTTECYPNCDGVILQWTQFDPTLSSFTPGNYYLWDNGDADGYTKKSATIMLGTATVQGTFNIDMNGLNLEMNNKDVRAFQVGYNSKLNLCNSKTTGGVVEARGNAKSHSGVVLLSNYNAGTEKNDCTAELNLYGVSLKRLSGVDTVTASGAIRVTANCTLNAWDCEIIGGKTTSGYGTIEGQTGSVLNLTNVNISGGSSGNGAGGNVLVGGTATFNNVNISGGSATGGNGGNLCVTGTLNMTGGSVTGGSASGWYGGNVYITGAGTATLRNVEITDGSAGYGGNVCVKNASTGNLTMYGCTVENGTATERGGNLWFGQASSAIDSERDKLIALYNCIIEGGTAAGGGSVFMQRRVAMNDTTVGVTTGGYAQSGYGGNVTVASAELVLNGASRIANGEADENGGNVYVTGEKGKLTMNDSSSLQAGEAVNGGNVYVDSGALRMSGTSSMSGGVATIAGGNIAMANGAQAEMLKSSFLTGGGYTGAYGMNATAVTQNGGNVYVGAKCSFSMSDNTVARNSVSGGDGQGGNFYLTGSLTVSGNAEVFGGLTGNNSEKTHRNIHLASSTASLTVSGNAKIDGGVVAGFGSVTLSDTPTICEYKSVRTSRTLYLGKDVVIDATGLTEGANVALFDSYASPTNGNQKIATVSNAYTGGFYVPVRSTLGIAGFEVVQEGTELWLKRTPKLTTKSGGTVTEFYNFADAVAASDDGYITMLRDAYETITLTKDLYLDLAGNTLTGKIVKGEFKLYGIDSATDGYSDTNAGLLASTIEGGAPETNVRCANLKRYIAVPATEGYSFHRIYLSVTHVSFQPAKMGVGYKAIFAGDETVKGYLDAQNSFGVVLQVGAQPTGLVEGCYAPFTDFSAGLEAGNATPNQKRILVQNVDLQYADEAIYGCAYMKLADGTVILSNTVQPTLKDVVKMMDTAYTTLTPDQKTVLDNFYTNNEAVVKDWGLQNIGKKEA